MNNNISGIIQIYFDEQNLKILSKEWFLEFNHFRKCTENYKKDVLLYIRDCMISTLTKGTILYENVKSVLYDKDFINDKNHKLQQDKSAIQLLLKNINYNGIIDCKNYTIIYENNKKRIEIKFDINPNSLFNIEKSFNTILSETYNLEETLEDVKPIKKSDLKILGDNLHIEFNKDTNEVLISPLSKDGDLKDDLGILKIYKDGNWINYYNNQQLPKEGDIRLEPYNKSEFEVYQSGYWNKMSPFAGAIRYSSSYNRLEYWDGWNWNLINN